MKILAKNATSKGPAEWFTGDVYISPLKPTSDDSRLSISSVHFTPGARTAWHSHPSGQTLLVTEGLGVIQCKGGPIKLLRPGDVIWAEPNEEHWHGASSDSFMSHLAIQELDSQGNLATWGDQISDARYKKQPK